MRHTAIAILVFLSAVSLTARQAVTGAASPLPQNPQDARPPRDPNKPNDAGTGRIRGRVIGGDTGAPLRRATVTLYGDGYESARAAVTDDAGRYEFKEVAAGSVRLTAVKGGYVDVNYGQRRSQQPGQDVDLAPGQTINVDFNLPRGGAITGRITDGIGEPAIGASVTVHRWQYANGKRQLLMVNGAATDDLGRFRVFGLPAGDYYVSATLDQTRFIPSESRVGTCRTFYPGTANQFEARRLRVTAGGENSTVNFALLMTHTAQVSGTVLDSAGRAADMGGVVSAIQTDDSTVASSNAGMIRQDGTFLIPNLNPGDYQLLARLGRESRENEIATMPLTVGTEDITDLTLVTVGPSVVTGQVIFDGPVSPNVSPDELMFGIRPLTRAGEMTSGGPISVRDDWTFEARLQASPVLIRGGDISQKWTVKTILQGGVDVTDTGIQFKPGEAIDNVQLVMTDRTTMLTGSVVTERGTPAADSTVVIFPEDSAHWIQDWRYIKTEQPDARGVFSVKGLPPGRYLAIAVQDLEESQSSDHEFLEQSRDHATPFTLADGERKTLSLTFKP